MKKYKILFDYGTYEGCKFQDMEFATVREAVKYAVELQNGSPFLIVQIVDWEATEKCPYDDCPKVRYKECSIHGEANQEGK